jgi:uncharacterized protein YndB with AHSA1/START domain
VFAAFLDPEILLKWLPPNDMTGVFHEFDGRVGGGYRMSLFYNEAEEESHVGKTGDLEDQVVVRFDAIEPYSRIVESFHFATNDPEMQGEVTQTILLEAREEGGVLVTLYFERLPPALKAVDNDLGAQISLGQLAKLFGA